MTFEELKMKAKEKKEKAKSKLNDAKDKISNFIVEHPMLMLSSITGITLLATAIATKPSYEERQHTKVMKSLEQSMNESGARGNGSDLFSLINVLEDEIDLREGEYVHVEGNSTGGIDIVHFDPGENNK